MNCFVIAAVLSVMATSAHAATFALVPQVGLAGIGATVQWGFTPYLAMSAGYTALDYSVKDVKTDEATYNGDLSLKNPQVYLSWAPFGGHFRVSAGAINQQSNFDLTASNFKDPQASAVNSVNIKADYAKSLAPALTLGWESPIMATGLGYHISVGAMFAGEPVVKTKPDCKDSNSPAEDAFCASYTANERKKVEDELRSYKVLPILQAGLIFRM